MPATSSSPRVIISQALLPGSLPAPDLDDSHWEELWILARVHCLTPYLHQRWSESGAIKALPERIRIRFEEARLQNSERNLRMLLELDRLKRMLGGRGINSLTLKGLPIAERFYGDLGLRVLYDLDLLVRPHDFEKALSLLEADGYVCYFADRPKKAGSRLLWKPKEYSWDAERVFDPERPVFVELHVLPWEPHWHGFQVECNLSFWRGATDQHASGVAMAVPALEKTFVQLCVHYACNVLESNARLMHLLDVGLLLRSSGSSLDWSEVMRDIGASGVESFCFVTLDLARRICGAGTPDEIGRALRDVTPPGIARWLEVEGVDAAHAMNLYSRDPRRIYRLHWAMTAGWREKFEVLAYSVRNPWQERTGSGRLGYFLSRMLRRVQYLLGWDRRMR